MADNNKEVFPRFGERNWWVLRDQFKKKLPPEVTSGYLRSLLQYDTEEGARNLIPPLKQLGLINDEGKPTDRANDWRNDSKYAEACAEMLNTYPEELRDLYNDKNADKSAVENWFQHRAKLGQGTAKQSAALYLLLLDATPKSSSDFAKPKSQSSTTAKRPAKSSREKTVPISSNKGELKPSEASSNEAEIGVSPADQASSDWLSLHIDLQIHISPDADAEQIDQIFASMAKHIMSMKHSTKEGND